MTLRDHIGQLEIEIIFSVLRGGDPSFYLERLRCLRARLHAIVALAEAARR